MISSPKRNTEKVPGSKAVRGAKIEHELLLACARVEVDVAEEKIIKGFLGGDIDWKYLIGAGLQHGIIPLLFRNLTRVIPEAIPRDVKDELSTYFVANAHRNLHLTAELLRVLNLFDTQGIQAIPYKGPVLSAFVYGDQSLRQFSDIDILIRKRSVQTAKDLLISIGYRPDPKHQLDFEAHFFHPENGCVLDLHWGISFQSIYREKDASFAIDLQGVWERVKLISLAGSRVLHFSPEDLLMIRCQDAVKEYWKDSWPQLKWICDIAEIVRVNPDMDWGRVLGEAKNLGNQRLLYFCLLLTEDLLGEFLPRHVMQSIKTDSKARSLAFEVGELFFRSADSPDRFTNRRNGILERCLFCVRLKESKRDRIPYYLRFLREYRRSVCRAVKNRDDRELLLLPPSLFFLYYAITFAYYLLRPVWRVGRYGTSRFKLIRNILKTPRQSSIPVSSQSSTCCSE